MSVHRSSTSSEFVQPFPRRRLRPTRIRRWGFFRPGTMSYGSARGRPGTLFSKRRSAGTPTLDDSQLESSYLGLTFRIDSLRGSRYATLFVRSARTASTPPSPMLPLDYLFVPDGEGSGRPPRSLTQRVVVRSEDLLVRGPDNPVFCCSRRGEPGPRTSPPVHPTRSTGYATATEEGLSEPRLRRYAAPCTPVPGGFYARSGRHPTRCARGYRSRPPHPAPAAAGSGATARAVPLGQGPPWHVPCPGRSSGQGRRTNTMGFAPPESRELLSRESGGAKPQRPELPITTAR